MIQKYEEDQIHFFSFYNLVCFCPFLILILIGFHFLTLKMQRVSSAFWNCSKNCKKTIHQYEPDQIHFLVCFCPFLILTLLGFHSSTPAKIVDDYINSIFKSKLYLRLKISATHHFHVINLWETANKDVHPHSCRIIWKW